MNVEVRIGPIAFGRASAMLRYMNKQKGSNRSPCCTLKEFGESLDPRLTAQQLALLMRYHPEADSPQPKLIHNSSLAHSQLKYYSTVELKVWWFKVQKVRESHE